ncbi:MAK10-like protein [Tanacetum coccineum]
MENENPIRTLGDYSIPSHEGYRNTIELPDGNKVVSLRPDTIWLVQNGCSFHGLRSEDPNQHLKDFLKLLDSLDLDVANRERTRLHLKEFFDYVGITHQIFVPYSPEQKGVAERRNRTLMEASRSSTPILGAAESTLDTPLVSQESSIIVLLPTAFDNAVDDRLIFIVPSEVNSP